MKILISDFDETLFTDNYEKNIFYTNKFVDDGNIFIIATGRPIYLLEKDISNYNIKYSYLICNDGAVIFNKNKELIYKKNIDQTIATNIYQKLKEDSNYSEVYIDSIFKFSTNTNDICNGIIAKPLDKSLVENTIKELIKKYPTIHGYLSHKWLNIVDRKVGKDKAIDILINKNNWNRDDVIVVGDNKNDFDMIREYNGYLINNKKLDVQVNYKLITDYLDIFNKIKK